MLQSAPGSFVSVAALFDGQADSPLPFTLRELKNAEDFDGFNEVYGRYFPKDPPARACLKVDFVLPGVLVEIEVTALALAELQEVRQWIDARRLHVRVGVEVLARVESCYNSETVGFRAPSLRQCCRHEQSQGGHLPHICFRQI